MAAKRSKFVQRTEIPRVGERRPVSVEGTCRVAGSDIRDVRVIDLDAHGCNLRGLSIGVSKSDPLELWLGSAGPIAARLRWAKRGAVGVAFDAPLDEATLAAVGDSPPEPTVVPLRRRLGS